jgi:hypothetical protein
MDELKNSLKHQDQTIEDLKTAQVLTLKCILIWKKESLCFLNKKQ